MDHREEAVDSRCLIPKMTTPAAKKLILYLPSAVSLT
jgi:hypothetical protein